MPSVLLLRFHHGDQGARPLVRIKDTGRNALNALNWQQIDSRDKPGWEAEVVISTALLIPTLGVSTNSKIVLTAGYRSEHNEPKTSNQGGQRFKTHCYTGTVLYSKWVLKVLAQPNQSGGGLLNLGPGGKQSGLSSALNTDSLITSNERYLFKIISGIGWLNGRCHSCLQMMWLSRPCSHTCATFSQLSTESSTKNCCAKQN